MDIIFAASVQELDKRCVLHPTSNAHDCKAQKDDALKRDISSSETHQLPCSKSREAVNPSEVRPQ